MNYFLRPGRLRRSAPPAIKPATKSTIVSGSGIELSFFSSFSEASTFMLHPLTTIAKQINKITIQSGGTVNSDLIREGLIDMVSLVISPVLIGGKDTPTIMDGYSIESEKELKFIKTLKLKKCEKLNNSYLHLLYEVN